MRRCYLGTALVLGGLLLTGVTPTGSCGIGTLTVYAAEDTFSGELVEAIQNEVVTEDNVETEIPTEETAEQVVMEETPEALTGNSFSLEDQEYQVLLKIVEAEAGCEDTEGRMLVANVVMNRVRNGYFPNTVTEVVYQRQDGTAQFSPVSDGRIDTVNVSQGTIDAVARVMNGEDISQGALFFRSVRSRSGWFDQKLSRVLEHGNHIFYTM
ncbi:MAG: cell wall hydrolase [Clostridiaceae bacterium]|nr:cell wall hydrolase [Clostridiaceae bacterium]MDD5797597.1 cell wall hydrolase [Clostridiaceae bacterium]MDY4545707.1 cell wall hydrolase [Candidatus Choladocola sp.]